MTALGADLVAVANTPNGRCGEGFRLKSCQLTSVQRLFTRNPSPHQPYKDSLEYFLLPPKPVPGVVFRRAVNETFC